MALGKLSAGLAHEINNPASAAMRAIESLRRASQFVLDSLIELAEQGASADQFLALERMRVEVRDRPVILDGTLDFADREEALGVWMDERDVQPAWQLAPTFAARGLDETWLERVENVTESDTLGPALRWISSSIAVAGLLDELTDSTSRITHLVQDVKTYSQMDRASLQLTDIPSGIESTLTMLAPKLHGINVERSYADDVPDIEVYAAELNQVWTNLLDNAIDAIDGTGSLRIATRLDGDDVVVEITDSGPGIAPDIANRVFEPFFTTKDVGSGTGLGLDITRRIVSERHGGQIEFDSVPGSTTARVRLPIRR
jgi:signal transduction histidine kinase